MEFSEKTIVITGASSGIGYQLAKDLSKYGAKLALLARRKDKLDLLANEISSNTFVKTYRCDVADKQEVRSVFDSVKTDFGKIDIAILNSGIDHRSSVQDYKAADAKKIYDINVMGIINCVEELLPEFKSSRSGYIVGVSSLADARGFLGSGFYCSSKAAVTILLESLRVELKSYNVKVITVKPGFVKTPMTDKNRFAMPFLMSVEKASKIILRGLQRDKKVIEFPLRTALAAKFVKVVPNALFDYLSSKNLEHRY